jgi:hypothetical protein
VQEFIETFAQNSPERKMLTEYKEYLLHEVPNGKERAEEWLNWRNVQGAVQQVKQWHQERQQQASGVGALAQAAGITPLAAAQAAHTATPPVVSPPPTVAPPSSLTPQTSGPLARSFTGAPATPPAPRSIAEALEKVPSGVTVGHRLAEIEPYVKGNTAVWAAVEKVNAATERLVKTPEYETTKTALEALPAEMLRDYARLEAGAAKEAMRPKVQELIHALAAKEHPAGETEKIKATEQNLSKKVGAAEKSMQELGKTPAYQELIQARKNQELELSARNISSWAMLSTGIAPWKRCSVPPGVRCRSSNMVLRSIRTLPGGSIKPRRNKTRNGRRLFNSRWPKPSTRWQRAKRRVRLVISGWAPWSTVSERCWEN